MNFETNEKWETITTPSIGNIVQLKYNDGFPEPNDLQVEIIKNSQTNKEFKGKILRIHGTEIINGEKDGGDLTDQKPELVSKEIYFDKINIFEILK